MNASASVVDVAAHAGVSLAAASNIFHHPDRVAFAGYDAVAATTAATQFRSTIPG